MPRYDYKCPRCQHIQQDVSISNWNDVTATTMVFCPSCDQQGIRQPMDRLPSAPNFSIGGFNAKNGYGLR